MPSTATLRARTGRFAARTARALCWMTAGVLAPLVIGARASHAQNLEDAEMLKPRELHATAMYGHDAWDEYWEGGLKRSNGNIGTVSTSSVRFTGAYGVNERLTVLASLPYVWTDASQGVLHGMSGRQDFTLMAKYRVLNPLIGGRARLKVLVVGAAAAPTSDYTPDFLPMSIGLQSKRLVARGAAHLQDRTGWFFDGYAERQFRSNVKLDRASYYTNGQLIESNEVAMPDVAQYRAVLGWQSGAWCIPVGFTEQRTLGGGDIRRQDMPFVSNRMNFTTAHAEVMYFLPRVSGLRLDLGAARTLRGRNVGQSTMIMTGLTYALHL